MITFLDMIRDRKGNISLYKTLFLIGTICFLAGWVISAYNSKTVPEMPNSLSVFLGVIGGAQLTRTHLANKNSQNLENNEVKK